MNELNSWQLACLFIALLLSLPFIRQLFLLLPWLQIWYPFCCTNILSKQVRQGRCWSVRWSFRAIQRCAFLYDLLSVLRNIVSFHNISRVGCCFFFSSFWQSSFLVQWSRFLNEADEICNIPSVNLDSRLVPSTKLWPIYKSNLLFSLGNDLFPS